MDEDLQLGKQPGIVYTFYSYKGGVGRSMALTSVGAVIAAEGKRVLLVDWDLEAPGIEAYFRKAASLKGDPVQVPGVVDLLESHAKGESLSWRHCLLKAQFFGYSLDIISAGRRSEDYRKRVQMLDWQTLYREHRVGNYINALREEWRGAYDFVLIDSRTGITDIGDICTVLLPDVLVLFFVTTHQSVEGAKMVMARAVGARSKLPVNRTKLLAVPVPSRDDRKEEYDSSLEWEGIFADKFGALYREWLPEDIEPVEALNRLFIPYVPKWSFGERIPVIESERERTDPTSIGAAFVRLATLLSHRLDWSAVADKASAAELVSARVELSAAREKTEQARSATREMQKKLKWKRTRVAIIAGSAALIATIVSIFSYRTYSYQKRASELVNAITNAYASLDQQTSQDEVKRIWDLRRLDDVKAVSYLGDLWRSDQVKTLAPNVAARLKDPDPKVRWNATKALGLIGEGAEKFVPDLAALLKDTDPNVRSGAATALGQIGEAAAKFAPDVAALLKDPDPNVRSSAATALGHMGQGPAELPLDLAALLKDPDPNVRSGGAKALGLMGQTATKFAADLAALLKDADPSVRSAAAEALGKLGRAGAKFAPDLAALLKDREPYVRSAAAKALGGIGKAGVDFAPEVAVLLKDPDSGVRSTAASALLHMGISEGP
jgi:HEAT repeat protein/cellulose biosynthesis protein BcsQ